LADEEGFHELNSEAPETIDNGSGPFEWTATNHHQEVYHNLIEENRRLKDALAANELHHNQHSASTDKLNSLVKVKSTESLNIFKELEAGQFVQDTFKYDWREP